MHVNYIVTWYKNLNKRKNKRREVHLKTIEITCIKADAHLSEGSSGPDGGKKEQKVRFEDELKMKGKRLGRN